MTRRLCIEYVDPRRIEAILAYRLIPLDKGEGKIRPIGVGEVVLQIMIDACGSLQVCPGHRSGAAN